MNRDIRIKWRSFAKIIIPIYLSFILFGITIFAVFIPCLETHMHNQKQEMIKTLNQSNADLTLSLLKEYNRRGMSQELSRHEAQSRAIQRIRHLRFGRGEESYFWIVNTRAQVLMHPFYPPDQNDSQVQGAAKAFFTRAVAIALKDKEGFLAYEWAHPETPGKAIPKLSYVAYFEPWQWVIGTAAVVEDISREIYQISRELLLILSVILGASALLTIYATGQAIKTETRRRRAEHDRDLDTLRLRKLNELNQMKNADQASLARFAMDEAVFLTQSRLGFLAFLDPDETGFTVACASQGALGPSGLLGRRHPACKDKGIETVIQKRKAVIAGAGHSDGTRVTVPVFDGDRIVAVAVVGGKKEAYDRADLRQVRLLMDGMWKIHSQKRSEAALRESEERYRLLAENAADCIWTLRLSDRRLQYISPSVEAILGYSPDEIRGLPLNAYLPDDALDRIATVVSRERLEHGLFAPDPMHAWTVEFTARKKNGALIWTEATLRFLHDSQMRPNRLMGITRDIDARKQMEHQLRHSQKLEAIGTLAGGIAHDFNNILSSILGFAELIKIKHPGRTDLDKDVNQILAAGIRARDLARHILIFSRQQDLPKKPIPISPLVKESLKFIRASVPKTINIIPEIQANPYRVVADPSQVQQVVINLCTNAAQAMGKGQGEIRVELKAVDPEAAGQPDIKPGPCLRLSVRDTGCGIPPAHLDRIFEPFFTTKPREKGTGMGLSIVHGIVHEMGGKIRVDSVEGTGTRFDVFFPALEGRPLVPIARRPPLATGSGTVLLVDDEAAVVAATRQIISSLGYEAVGITDSRTALDLFRDDPMRFDAVLADVSMPGLDGLDLAAEIPGLRPGIPVVLCTGFSQGLTRKAVRQQGIFDLVMKPMIAEEVARILSKALDNN